ncbi:MAG: hypothetical protein AAGF79_00115 [Pseudomonadota bacterium]
MRHLLARTAGPLLLLLVVIAAPAAADDPVIEAVTAQDTGSGWTFDVTLSHPDTGWDHYADGWRVLSMEGEELGLRVLYHPHVNEQPFTRSLSGVEIPEGQTQVRVQARCIVHGWSDETYVVELN